MSAAVDERSWFEQLVAHSGHVSTDQNPAWFDSARAQARQALAELPVPNRKQESWRYSAVEGLLKHSFQPAAASAVSSLQELDSAGRLLPAGAAYRLVFADGYFVPQLSSDARLPDGVTLGNLRTALGSDSQWLARWFDQAASHAGHLFTALNTALANDGALLHVEANIAVDRPIEIVYLNLDQSAATLMQPRNLVVLESGASATLVEHFRGDDAALYFNNTLSEIVLGDGATLMHYRVQEESRSAWHLSSLYLSQAQHSRYRGTTLAFGGAWSRTDYNAHFMHAGAECDLNGLYTVGDRQLTDFHLDVQHSVPGCRSRERFKGILYGKGRAVFDGRILVDKQAQLSDAQLTNDNLMLTRDAEVDTKPQLEIYADDVKCSHGTTVGQLDPEQVFYLRSRGLAASAAHKMLCLGFAGEIIDTIELPALRDYATSRLADTINAAVVEG
ncbi:MAG: Fe-S cluster assembly protein SufD [Gammaproteobacteria bacterium]